MSDGIQAKATGQILTKLRAEAGVTQAALAQNLTVSPARVSRIESGDVELTQDEMAEYLRVLGTDRAADFGRYLQQAWSHIQRPDFEHPDLIPIRLAEETLQRIAELRTPELTSAFAKQLDLFEARIKQHAIYLQSTQHSIAFLGSIGVGKSTAICTLTGLRLQGPEQLNQQMALEVGGGGTTVCEVRIRRGPRWGLSITPRPDDAIRADVTDFCEYLIRVTSTDTSETPETNIGVPRETERVIRNMSRLTVVSKKDDGRKRIRTDPAKELVSTFPEVSALAVEILTRMDLPRRQTRVLWYPEGSSQAPMEWLQAEFAKINNGRNAEVTIPDLIEVTMPDAVFAHPHLQIEIIDTKGIDQTVQREDLERHFDDPRTLTVLCSAFLDAPEQAVQTLLERAISSGVSRVAETTLVLVLARPGEAAAMKDDSGNAVQDDHEGYDFKRDQVDLALRRITPAEFMVEFFNAKYDDLTPVRDSLLRALESMRRERHEQIHLLAAQIETLIANREREEATAVLQEALSHVRVWLERNRDGREPTGSVQRSLITAISTVHPASVRASVRRHGSWQNLDYYYQIGFEAKRIAAQHIKSRVDELAVIVTNLLHNKEFAAAHGILSELLAKANDLVESLLRKAQLTGQTLYEEALRGDVTFWQQSAEQWGLGSGYRERVANVSDGWFAVPDQQARRKVVLDFVQSAWQGLTDELEGLMTSVSEPVAS